MKNSILLQVVDLDEFYEKLRTTVRDELIFQKSCEEVTNKKLLTRK